MKISQKKLSKKHWLITAIVIIILLSVGIGVYALNNKTSEKSSSPSSSDQKISPDDSPPKINTDAPTQDEIDAGNSTKSNNATQSPTPSASKTLSITANNTGSTIQIRSTITTQTESGSCSLVLTKGDTTITKDAVGIQALPGYSTCKGWDIDISTLSPGSWKATVTATYDSTPNTATADFKI